MRRQVFALLRASLKATEGFMYCPQCGKQIAGGNAFCRSCGNQVSDELGPTGIAACNANHEDGEQTFLSSADILVTNHRIVAGGKLYAVRNVSSVARLSRKPGANLAGALFGSFLGIGLMCLIVSRVAGLAIILLGVPFLVWMAFGHREYIIRLAGAGGEIGSLVFIQADLADKVTNAIEQAIASR